MKITTLTLNPALDKSTATERLVPEQKLRCGPLQIDAGGGGINVSKGIRKLGGDSMAVFPVGGNNGRFLCEVLAKDGIQMATLEFFGHRVHFKHPVPLYTARRCPDGGRGRSLFAIDRRSKTRLFGRQRQFTARVARGFL